MPYNRAMRFQLLCAAVVLAHLANAQERFGLAHSNYNPTDAAYLNPARTAGQWPYTDIRILGADVHAWNSLVAWSDRDRALVGEVRNGLAGQANGSVVRRGNALSDGHKAVVQANVLGPAVSLALGRGTFGIGMRSRVHISGSGVSKEMANYMFEGLNYAPQIGQRYHDRGVRMLGAAWTEFGVSYAHILKAEGFSMISAGVTLRYNIGHGAGALQFTDLDYTVFDTARLDVHNATARYGFAMPSANAGSGWGADLGAVYERTMDEADGYRPHKGASGCTPMRYRYRIGVSLIDLGGIRFRNAEAGTISTGSLSIADHQHVPVQGVEGVDSLLATSTNWTRTNAFKVGAPTALSVQYDQRLANNTYIAFAAVQQLAGRNTTRLRRSNSMAITPRFETRYFEAALPIVMHEYDVAHPSIGFMLRLNGLVVGSDQIMPFISKGDVYALDLYVRVRWMIFRSPACRGKRTNKKHRSGSKEMIPCSFPGGG